MNIYRQLITDCTNDNHIYSTVTLHEHGVVKFQITTLNNSRLINLSNCTGANYYGTKSDGHIVGIKCEIDGDKVILPLTLQMTACAGVLNGVLELTFESGNIRFSGINFMVLPAPEMVDIESTDEFTILEELIEECKNAVNNVAVGKSAYQVAVENGFAGTESEWLESLKGKSPEKGVDYYTEQDKQEIINDVLSNFIDVSEVGM